MNPEAAKTVANFLIADFEGEIQTTLRVLQAVPEAHLDYCPDTKSASGLGLVRHLTLLDEWFLNSIADGKFAPPPKQTDECGILTPTNAAACYQEKVPKALDRVRTMSGEQLSETIDLFGVMQMPAVNFLSLAEKHSIHHRGQLSAYLRAMGGRVPGIYGPSGDK